jgi:hypothetical protein
MAESSQTPVPECSQTAAYRYWAFISYSHKDKIWGDWLHPALDSYKTPKLLVGLMNKRGEKVPERPYPIFRDREELPIDADLGSVITEALQQSRYLIVICSPNSVQSRFVNDEILYYKKLGRANRILPLIVGGEPNADGKPGFTEAQECFPGALKYELGPDGALDKIRRSKEPIAGDARPKGDGKINAKLKLLAGILGVNYDDLKRRDEDRRRKRQRIVVSLTVVALLSISTTYVAAVDDGLNLPESTRLREIIDTHRWSVFRPIYSADRISAEASLVRKELLISDEKHCLTEAGFPAGSDDRDQKSGVWASSQLACGVLHCPEASEPQVETALRAIESAFESSQLMEYQGSPLGWLASKNEIYPSFEPTAWTCAALAAALGRSNCLKGVRREKFETWLGVAQKSMARFEFKPGCYSSYATADPSFGGSDYSTVLALGVMLDCKEGKLAWQGSMGQLDAKLRSAVEFLCSHFRASKTPPGWTLVVNSNWDASPGLTMQILAELLRAQRVAHITVPERIFNSARDWVEFAAKTIDIEDKDYFTQTFVTPEQQLAQADRTVGFLHQPWAIALLLEWRQVASALHDARYQLALADRGLSYQIVDRASETVQSGTTLPFYFSAEYFWTTSRLP